MQQWPQAISKRSLYFSKRSELVGDSNFPDKCSDLSDGQIGVNPRLLGAALLSGERFTMDGLSYPAWILVSVAHVLFPTQVSPSIEG
ncbi:MAG: hypothetical protein ACW7DM_08735 [Paraglaciecola chathamensis]